VHNPTKGKEPQKQQVTPKRSKKKKKVTLTTGEIRSFREPLVLAMAPHPSGAHLPPPQKKNYQVGKIVGT